MTDLHRSEKTLLFWFGVLILGSATVALFWSLWYSFVIAYSYPPPTPQTAWLNLTPITFGSIVFLLIAVYMMKSGVKKDIET